MYRVIAVRSLKFLEQREQADQLKKQTAHQQETLAAKKNHKQQLQTQLQLLHESNQNTNSNQSSPTHSRHNHTNNTTAATLASLTTSSSSPSSLSLPSPSNSKRHTDKSVEVIYHEKKTTLITYNNSTGTTSTDPNASASTTSTSSSSTSSSTSSSSSVGPSANSHSNSSSALKARLSVPILVDDIIQRRLLLLQRSPAGVFSALGHSYVPVGSVETDLPTAVTGTSVRELSRGKKARVVPAGAKEGRRKLEALVERFRETKGRLIKNQDAIRLGEGIESNSSNNNGGNVVVRRGRSGSVTSTSDLHSSARGEEELTSVQKISQLGMTTTNTSTTASTAVAEGGKTKRRQKIHRSNSNDGTSSVSSHVSADRSPTDSSASTSSPSHPPHPHSHSSTSSPSPSPSPSPSSFPPPIRSTRSLSSSASTPHLHETRLEHITRWRNAFDSTKQQMDRALIKRLVARAENRAAVQADRERLEGVVKKVGERVERERAVGGGKGEEKRKKEKKKENEEGRGMRSSHSTGSLLPSPSSSHRPHYNQSSARLHSPPLPVYNRLNLWTQEEKYGEGVKQYGTEDEAEREEEEEENGGRRSLRYDPLIFDEKETFTPELQQALALLNESESGRRGDGGGGGRGEREKGRGGSELSLPAVGSGRRYYSTDEANASAAASMAAIQASRSLRASQSVKSISNDMIQL